MPEPRARQVAAQRGAVGRRRIVRQRQAALVQRPFQRRADDAGLRAHRQRLLVDLEDLVEPLGVDARSRHGSAARRPACPSRRPTARPASGARGRRRGRGRPPRRCPDGRSTSRARRRDAAVERHLRQPRGVDRVDQPVGVARRDVRRRRRCRRAPQSGRAPRHTRSMNSRFLMVTSTAASACTALATCSA